MASSAIETIMKYYLYGSNSVPSNLASDSLIRTSGSTTTITLDIANHMSTAGRFAKPSQFDVVKEFFNVNNSGLFANNQTYSLTEVLNILNLSASATEMKTDHKLYAEGTDYLVVSQT
tara:strand:- start:1490 stop:1843 length:354 start_codon:yes stop_codon:yes gene_type:complete